MDQIIFKKKRNEKPIIRGIETITIFDSAKENKSSLLKLGYCAYSIFIKKDVFLFDFCIN